MARRVDRRLRASLVLQLLGGISLRAIFCYLARVRRWEPSAELPPPPPWRLFALKSWGLLPPRVLNPRCNCQGGQIPARYSSGPLLGAA